MLKEYTCNILESNIGLGALSGNFLATTGEKPGCSSDFSVDRKGIYKPIRIQGLQYNACRIFTQTFFIDLFYTTNASSW